MKKLAILGILTVLPALIFITMKYTGKNYYQLAPVELPEVAGCENSSATEEKTSAEFEYQKGIGLKNVTRRLDLLYEGAYELAIRNSNDTYSVTLTLELDQLLIRDSEWT